MKEQINPELYDSLKLNTTIYYYVNSTDELESSKIENITYGHQRSNYYNNCITLENGRVLYFSAYKKTWFTNITDAEARVSEIHNHPIHFGDTVKVNDLADIGVVYSVDYQVDEEYNVTPLFSVALKDRCVCNVEENKLELISDTASLMRSCRDIAKKKIADLLLDLLDTPKYKKMLQIPKKDVIKMIENL